MIPLLGLPLLMCLALAAVMGYLGIHVLKREIIFIDIALAQLAAVGAIAAHLAFHAHQGSALSFLVAFAFVLMAAGFYAFARRKVAQIPIEAVIGVSYAITAAGALFLVGVAPGGHIHVQHMLAGSILWVTWRDVLVCVAAFAAVGGLFRLFCRPLTRMSEDYDGAIREGVNVVLWDFVLYALCGLVITLAVQVAGVVVVFAFLIIPATISALFASGWLTRLLIAWAAGSAASALGLLFAYRLDFSPGPPVAMFLGIELGLVGVWSLWRSKAYAAVAMGGLAALLTILLLTGPAPEGAEYPAAVEEHPPRLDLHHAREEHAHEEEGEQPADFGSLVERTADAAALTGLFEKAPDEGARSDVVVRALGVDLKTGVRLSIRFLRRDPPLFFRQAVVEELDRVTGKPSGFVPEEPCSADANRAAVSDLETEFAVDAPGR